MRSYCFSLKSSVLLINDEIINPKVKRGYRKPLPAKLTAESGAYYSHLPKLLDAFDMGFHDKKIGVVDLTVSVYVCFKNIKSCQFIDPFDMALDQKKICVVYAAVIIEVAAFVKIDNRSAA